MVGFVKHFRKSMIGELFSEDLPNINLCPSPLLCRFDLQIRYSIGADVVGQAKAKRG